MNRGYEINFYELNDVINTVKGFLDLCATIENHGFLTHDFNMLASDLKERLDKASIDYENKMLGK